MSRLGMMIGMDIRVVASGTEIGKDKDGAPLIVTDQNAVTSACCMWVTEKVFEELKARSTEAKDWGHKPYQAKIVERE